MTHQYDDDDGDIWQFHTGNSDYSHAVIELVQLTQVLRVAPELRDMPTVPRGWVASRKDRSAPWVLAKED